MLTAGDAALTGFHARFAGAPELLIRSPGRVNLIGDHTDYNDGFVLPIAILDATWIAASTRDDRVIDITSAGFGSARLHADRLEPKGSWSDYVAGTLVELGGAPTGFNAYIHSTIPVGAGLSSSASLEIGIARLHGALNDGSWDPIRAAKAAQRAENEFIGVPTGIMDQLAIAAARVDHALLIDCRSLETHHIRLPPAATVVVLDTGTRRRLSESRYDTRRATCEQTAIAVGVSALRDATLMSIDAAGLDGVNWKRAKHVVTENTRVRKAAVHLEDGDLVTVGELMNESHLSLRDDFEVSSPELDFISHAARHHPACFGARMTGGGFAGCAVALIESASTGKFVADIERIYLEETGSRAALYPTSAESGVEMNRV